MCLGEIGEVARVWDEDGVRMAVVRTADAELRSSLLYLPEAQAGTYVLVHLGFAAKRLLVGLSPLTVGLARMGLGVLVLVGWLAVVGHGGDLAGLTPGQWGWALLTGTILAVYVAGWYAALARAQAVDVTAVLVLGAVVTALLDAAVKGRELASSGLGLALVLAGVLLALVAARVAREPPLAGGTQRD